MIALYALWCGFCWVLRGGLYGRFHRAAFGWKPGTQLTRAVSAVLMAAPLAVAFDPAFAVLALSVWAAMTIGYFDDAMGLVETPRDYLFMALWGSAVSLTMLLPLGYLVSPWALAWCGLGALAVSAYGINKPFGRRLGLDWTERAEICTGVAFGCALWSAT